MSLFGVFLVCIQSEYGKKLTRITPKTDAFHVVGICKGSKYVPEKLKVRVMWNWYLKKIETQKGGLRVGSSTSTLKIWYGEISAITHSKVFPMS